MGSIEGLSEAIEKDMKNLLPDMYKSPREKLAMMVACLVETRSCNTMELAARLPIESDREETRYAWIERFLSAKTIEDMDVMKHMTQRLFATLGKNGQTIVVSIDQTALDKERAIGMLSARVGNRALPLFWTVKRSSGNIPIKDYLPLLAMLKECLPDGAKIMLLGDRFFGTPELIAACQKHSFHYRLRLKGNLTATHYTGTSHVADIAHAAPQGLIDVELCHSIRTNIGYVHDNGHKEAWFIAMDSIPTRATTLEYGLRWSIETMFSDFKSRGFRFEDTHLQRTDRISRLLLVLAIALTWATANGIAVQKKLIL